MDVHVRNPDNSTQINQQIIIDSTDVRKALQHMKNGRAPVPGNIPAELLKAAPSIVVKILEEIFNKCLNGEEPPEEWKTAVISSIYKKETDAIMQIIEELALFVL